MERATEIFAAIQLLVIGLSHVFQPRAWVEFFLWLREKGQAQMDALLKANPKIDVVYAHNDPMAEGAYLAAKAVGREKEMKFLGIDALPIPSGGIKAVEQGRLSATFTYPTNGKEAITAAKKLLIDCGTIEKSQILPTRLIDASNAKEIYAEENPTG